MPRLYGGDVTTRSMVAEAIFAIPSRQSPWRRSNEVTTQFGHTRFVVQAKSSNISATGRIRPLANKHQRSSKQRSSKEQRRRLLFDAWCFSGAWSLKFGALQRSLGALRQPRDDIAFMTP